MTGAVQKSLLLFLIQKYWIPFGHILFPYLGPTKAGKKVCSGFQNKHTTTIAFCLNLFLEEEPSGYVHGWNMTTPLNQTRIC